MNSPVGSLWAPSGLLHNCAQSFDVPNMSPGGALWRLVLVLLMLACLQHPVRFRARCSDARAAVLRCAAPGPPLLHNPEWRVCEARSRAYAPVRCMLDVPAVESV